MSWHILKPKTAGQKGLVRWRSTLTSLPSMSTLSISSRSVMDVLISGSTIFESSSKILTRSCLVSCDTRSPRRCRYI